MMLHALTIASIVAIVGGVPAAAQCGGHAGHGQQPARQQHQHREADTKKAVNELCPIGKEPIDGRTFITYEGDLVGFCCPGCDESFLEWEKPRRDAFIAAAKGGPQPEPKPAPKATAAPANTLSVAYPLPNCPISGKQLGSMGEPVIKTYDNREVRFCCAACIPQFEANPAEHFKKIDEQIVVSQLAYYPMQTCIISGAPLGSMGEPDNYIYRNRLVRFCCDSCRDGFQKDPETHLAALDKAAADEQRASYPLTTCPVTNRPLGSMGEPAERILGGRLVRLCCPPCERQLRANPARFTAQLDDAWRKAGRPGLPEPAPGAR
jgi:YHS domain-containing protein